MIFALRPLEQVELDEARRPVEIAFATEPHGLELGLAALDDRKAVHRDVHAGLRCSRALRSLANVPTQAPGWRSGAIAQAQFRTFEHDSQQPTLAVEHDGISRGSGHQGSPVG